LEETYDKIEDEFDAIKVNFEFEIKKYPFNRVVITSEFDGIKNNMELYKLVYQYYYFGISEFNYLLAVNYKMDKDMLDEDQFKEMVLNRFYEPGTVENITRSEYKDLSGVMAIATGLVQYHGATIKLVEGYGESSMAIRLSKDTIKLNRPMKFIVN